MKILAFGAPLGNNFGGPSILYGVYEIWNSKIPNLEIVYIDSGPSTPDHFEAVTIPITVIPHSKKQKRKWLLLIMLYKIFGRTFFNKSEKVLLDAFLSADAVVDLWGIDFSDKLGMPQCRLRILFNHLYTITAALLKKKVIKYTSSFGPILTPRTRRSAILFLGKKTDLILCREQHSQEVLINIGIRTPQIVCPDSALAMKPEPLPPHALPEIFHRNKAIAAISVSYQILKQWKSRENYLDIMTRGIQYMTQEFSCAVLLIPNEIGFPKDDLWVAEEIYSRCPLKDSVSILPVESLRAPHLKYLISRCELMLASRYHSVVAGLSAGIPTLVIGWHHKYEELLSLFGQNEYLLDCQTCSANDVIQKISNVWNTRREIRQEITRHQEAIRKELDKGAYAFIDLLHQKPTDAL